MGRADEPGKGGAWGAPFAPVADTPTGSGTGTVGAAWGRMGMGVPGRTGAGSRPDGEIRLELELGAGGGVGGWVRTTLGDAGRTPGCPVGMPCGMGRMDEAGRGGGMNPRVGAT